MINAEQSLSYADHQSHSCRADKNPYRHDGRADKDSYLHDGRVYSLSLLPYSFNWGRGVFYLFHQASQFYTG